MIASGEATEIVMLTNATLPDKLGGLERYVSELAGALSERGMNVTLVAKRLDEAYAETEVTPDGVTVHRVRVPRKSNPAFALLYPLMVARGVRAVLRAHPDAAVHAHFAVPAVALALAPRRLRRRYVYTFHAPVYRELLRERQGSYLLPRPLQRLAVSLLRWAERLVVERAAAVVVLSEFMRSQLSELSPRAGRAAVLIPGGVDTERFTPGPVTPDTWADEARHLVVTARRLTPRTGVVELIRAMPEVTARHPGTRLAVMGDGLQRDVVRRSVEELGLEDSVRLLGRVDDDELLAWYRRADVAITPTQELEGFGLSTAEAMACGTTPVVTPVGANPELVTLLPSTCLLAGTTPGELASGLSRHLEALPGPDRDEVRAMTDSWSWVAVAARHVDLLARVMPTTSAGVR